MSLKVTELILLFSALLIMSVIHWNRKNINHNFLNALHACLASTYFNAACIWHAGRPYFKINFLTVLKNMRLYIEEK